MEQAVCTIEYNPINWDSVPTTAKIPFTTQAASLQPSLTGHDIIEWHWADGSIDYRPDPPEKDMAGSTGEHEVWVWSPPAISTVRFSNITDFDMNLGDLNSLINLDVLYLFFTACTGSLDDLDLLDLNNIDMSLANITGDPIRFINAVGFGQMYASGNPVTGDLSNLIGSAALAGLRFTNCSGITGAVIDFSILSVLNDFRIDGTGVTAADVNSMVENMWDNRVVLGNNALSAYLQTASPVSQETEDMILGLGDFLNDGLVQAGCTVFYTAPT